MQEIPTIHIVELFDSIWPILVAVFGGAGAIIAWFHRFKQQTKISVDEKLKLYHDRILSESNQVKNENAKLVEGMQKLAIDHAQMQAKWEILIGSNPDSFTADSLLELGKIQKDALTFLQEFTFTFPGLLWIKKRDERGNWIMYSLSRVYSELYLGKPPSFYIGKTDAEIWGNEIAEIFKKNDDEAMNRGIAIKVKENLVSPLTGISGLFDGWKWTFKIDKDIYTCGYGIHSPIEDQTNEVY